MRRTYDLLIKNFCILIQSEKLTMLCHLVVIISNILKFKHILHIKIV